MGRSRPSNFKTRDKMHEIWGLRGLRHGEVFERMKFTNNDEVLFGEDKFCFPTLSKGKIVYYIKLSTALNS